MSKKIFLVVTFILASIIYIWNRYLNVNPMPNQIELVESNLQSLKLENIRSTKFLKDISYPLEFDTIVNKSSQIGFHSVISSSQLVKFFSNYGDRKKMKETNILNIQGVTHFLLDHDLTSGFVHNYTTNFYKKLRKTDYVLMFKPSKKNEGMIEYIMKKDVTNNDTLGIQIAFFRQWKLSEIDINDGKIQMKPCTYSRRCVCPQVKPDATNPFKPQIPIWCESDKIGYHSINMFNKLDEINGGTVVIIWYDSIQNKTLFMDIHGSLMTIFKTAFSIKEKYKIDPVIGVHDAGPMAVKVKSNPKNELSISLLNDLSQIHYVGAGFGYVPMKASVFEICDVEGDIKRIVVKQDDELYGIMKNTK